MIKIYTTSKPEGIVLHWLKLLQTQGMRLTTLRATAPDYVLKIDKNDFIADKFAQIPQIEAAQLPLLYARLQAPACLPLPEAIATYTCKALLSHNEADTLLALAMLHNYHLSEAVKSALYIRYYEANAPLRLKIETLLLPQINLPRISLEAMAENGNFVNFAQQIGIDIQVLIYHCVYYLKFCNDTLKSFLKRYILIYGNEAQQAAALESDIQDGSYLYIEQSASGIAALQQIRYLALRGTFFEAVAKIKCLETLEIYGYTEMLSPALAELKHLRHLLLHDACLSEAPAFLECLEHLEILRLPQALPRRAEGICLLPDAWQQLKKLHYIHLKNQQINCLPHSLPPALRTLQVANNALTELPPAVAMLEQLQTLVISGNPLRILPPFLATMPTLRLIVYTEQPLNEEFSESVRLLKSKLLPACRLLATNI